jgi:uncharacterized membrane protein YfcA
MDCLGKTPHNYNYLKLEIIMTGSFSILLFLILSLIAEILGTIGGFGSSVFFVPIGTYFLDIHSVLGITAIFHLASNISKITLFRKGINRKLIFQFGIPAIFFVTIGAFLTRFIESNYLTIILDSFLIVLSLLLLLIKDYKVSSTWISNLFGGTLSGLFAGMLGTGGAIRGLFLSSFNLSKEVFIASSAFIDLGVDLSRTIVYYYNGYIHKDDYFLIPFLIFVGFIGSYIGKLILVNISEERFRKIVLGLVFIIGLISLIKIIT